MPLDSAHVGVGESFSLGVVTVQGDMNQVALSLPVITSPPPQCPAVAQSKPVPLLGPMCLRRDMRDTWDAHWTWDGGETPDLCHPPSPSVHRRELSAHRSLRRVRENRDQMAFDVFWFDSQFLG